jgi:E3 ubiquitin-protein ligase HUWE1
LVLNYMDRCLGVERAREAFEALWRVAEHEAGVFVEKAQKLDERESSVEAKGKAPRRQTNVASSSRKPSVDLSMTTTKILPAHVAAALRSATSLLLQLVDVDVLFGSSGSAANVVAPAGFVPTTDAKGLGTPSYPPPSDPRVFAARLHANLAPAVLAAWRSKALSFFPGEAASHLMSALVHLGKGTEKLPKSVAHHLEFKRLERDRSAGRASRGARSVGERLEAMIDRADREARGGVGVGAARPSRPPPPPFTPSPSMTASIAEMGFSEAQARAALVAVRGRSIELAMDWLFSHPNEARIADEEAAAAAAAPPAVAAESAGDAGAGGGAAAAVDGSGAAVDAAVAAVDVATTPAATPAAADPASPADAATPPAEDGDAELVRALQMSMRDEEEVDAEVPAAPEKSDRPEGAREDETPKETAPAVPDPPAPRVALPRPDELLEPILALSRANPSMAYSGAKLLARELRRAPADVKRNTMEKLVAALATDDETDLDLAVRLLVLVLVAEPAARRDAAAADAPRRLLVRLERFLAERKKRVGSSAEGSAKATADTAANDAADTAAGALAVTPGWATGSFLALHKLAEWRARLPMESAMDRTGSAAQLTFRERLGVPGGYLDPSTRARAAAACVRLLELTAVGGGAEVSNGREPDGATIARARTSDEEVGGVQAAMQLLVHLTKDHAIAARAHDEGVVGLILDLPARFAFPAYDALAASVLRHVVEDPHTLQLAMESEIHAVLSTGHVNNGRLGRARRDVWPATETLQSMLPVFLRDPAVFLTAFEKCAHMSSSAHGERTIALKSAAELKEAKERERERENEGAPSGSSRPKQSGANGRSAPPATFSSTIQALVAAVKAYPPRLGAGAGAGAAGTSSDMDTDEAGEGEEKPEKPKVVSAPTIAAVRASLALRLLTDFTLVYSAAAGQILRHGGDGKLADRESSDAGGSQTDLLRHVLYSQLAEVSPSPKKAGERKDEGAFVGGDGGWDGGERAAYFLLAMCVRSPEARRRVLAEVAKALALPASEGRDRDRDPNAPEGKPEAPARALVEFVNSLVKTAASKANLAGELQRGMRDAGLLRALCVALDRVDLDDVAAPALARAMLRPMETLTKPGAAARDRVPSTRPAAATETGAPPGPGAAGPAAPRGDAHGARATGAQALGAPGGGARDARRRRSTDGGASGALVPGPGPGPLAPGPGPGAPSSSLQRVASLEHPEHDPAQMARMGDEASRMFDTLMGGDDDDAVGEDSGESGDEESGEEDEDRSDDDDDDASDSVSDSEDPSGIDPMEDDEVHEEAAMARDDEDEDEDEDHLEARHAPGRHRGRRDDVVNARGEYAERVDDDDDEDEDEDEPDDVVDADGELDDVEEEEEEPDDVEGDEDVIHMGDDDEESDGVDDEEWEEADGVPLGMGLDGMDQDPMGFRHGAFAVDDDGEVPDDVEGADDDDLLLDAEGEEAERRAADQLAGRLQGIIAEAQRRGGEEPVVELRVRDANAGSVNLRALVSRRGGSAILRGSRPFDGGGAGRPGARADGDASRDLGRGGILSDIFALRRSLDDARRDADGGGAGDHARSRAGGRDAGASRPSAFESNVVWGSAGDAAFAGPAMHPMLLRPRIGDEEEAVPDAGATGAGSPSAAARGGERPGGGPQTASLQSVLASISGEMSRLAVAPGAGDFRGGGAPRGAPRARTDSGFVVLPEVESLGSLLRIERASDRYGLGDGRGGARAGFAGDMGRRGLSVFDARVATWRDVAALGPNEESPLHDTHIAAQDLEEVLEIVLKPPTLRTTSEKTTSAPEEKEKGEGKETGGGDVEMAAADAGVAPPEAAAPATAAAAAAATAAAPPASAAEPEPPAEAPAEAPVEPPTREDVPPPPPDAPEEVDSEFLNALPESLRRELVAANRAIARFNRAALEASGGADASAARDAMATATVPDASASAMTPDSPEIMDAVDPEFLAALPPDMQAEVVQQQTREVQRRARERVALADRRAAEAEAERARLNAAAPADPPGADAEARRAAAEAAAAACEAARRGALEAREAAAVVGVNVPPPASGAAAAAAPTPAQAQAELIASFPPEIRAEVLMTADAATLAALPPALQEEARDMGNLRGRNPETARHFLEGGFFARGGGGEGDPEDPRGVDRVAAAVGGDAAGRTFAEQLRSMLGLSGPGPSRGRGGGPGPFGLTAADRSALAAAPAEPAVDRAALFALLRLLRVSPPLSSKTSGSLPRVLLNVCAHAGTRDVVIKGLDRDGARGDRDRGGDIWWRGHIRYRRMRRALRPRRARALPDAGSRRALGGEKSARDADVPDARVARLRVARRARRRARVGRSRNRRARESRARERKRRGFGFGGSRHDFDRERRGPQGQTTAGESAKRKRCRDQGGGRRDGGKRSRRARGGRPRRLFVGGGAAGAPAPARLARVRVARGAGRARARVAAVRAHREQEGARAAGARLAAK